MSAATEERVDLPLSGMSCAACARSIENQLAATPGVASAHVNFATSTATVEFDPHVTHSGLVGAIEELGYDVPQPEQAIDVEEHRANELLTALLLAAAFSVAVAAARHVARTRAPAGDELDPIGIDSPVIGLAGAPFYAGAWTALRHRSANMNTLIALGTGAAFLYSLWLRSPRGRTRRSITRRRR